MSVCMIIVGDDGKFFVVFWYIVYIFKFKICLFKIYILLGKCKLFYDRKFKKIINKLIKNEFYIVLWILKFYNIFWWIF